MIDVSVLSLEGCGDTPATIELLKKTAAELDLSINLSHIVISSTEEAVEYQFPGSPTLRINGRDIEPSMRKVDHFGVT